MKNYKKKYLGEETSEEIDNEIAEKKAIPELKFKYDIFNSINEMNLSEEQFSQHLRERHIIDPNYKSVFECKMIKVFNLLKQMILSQKDLKKMCDDDFKNFTNLAKLEYLKKNFDTKSLIDMKNYLFREAHILNLTNLLRKELSPMEEFNLI